MLRLRGNILSIKPPSKDRYVILTDLCWTPRGTKTPHHTVKGEFCQPGDIAPHGRRDIVHHFDLHRARLRAGIALETTEEFRVSLYQCFYGRFHLLHIVDAFACRKEWNLREIHVGLNDGVPPQPHLDLISSWKPIDRSAGPTDPSPATTTSNQLISGILHRLLDGKRDRDFISFSHDKNGNQLVFLFLLNFHLDPPRYRRFKAKVKVCLVSWVNPTNSINSTNRVNLDFTLCSMPYALCFFITILIRSSVHP